MLTPWKSFLSLCSFCRQTRMTKKKNQPTFSQKVLLLPIRPAIKSNLFLKDKKSLRTMAIRRSSNFSSNICEFNCGFDSRSFKKYELKENLIQELTDINSSLLNDVNTKFTDSLQRFNKLPWNVTKYALRIN